jgi:hypothetical protein
MHLGLVARVLEVEVTNEDRGVLLSGSAWRAS